MKRTFLCLSVLLGSLAGALLCTSPVRGEATGESIQAPADGEACPAMSQHPCDPRYDATYDESYRREVLADQAQASESSDAWSYGPDRGCHDSQPHNCCPYYSSEYDEYFWQEESAAAPSNDEAVVEPEQAVVTESVEADVLDDASTWMYEEYGYEFDDSYQEVCPTEIEAAAEVEATAETEAEVEASDGDDCGYGDDYEYGYGDEYEYADESSETTDAAEIQAETEEATEEAVEEPATEVEDAVEMWESDYGYEDYGYDYSYESDYVEGYDEQAAEAVAEEAVEEPATEVEDAVEMWESDYGYEDYEDYGYDYSYESDYVEGYDERAVDVVEGEDDTAREQAAEASEVDSPTTHRDALLTLARALDQAGSVLQSLSRQLTQMAAPDVAETSAAEDTIQR